MTRPETFSFNAATNADANIAIFSESVSQSVRAGYRWVHIRLPFHTRLCSPFPIQSEDAKVVDTSDIRIFLNAETQGISLPILP